MFPSEKYVFDDITPEDEIVLSKQKFTQLEIERRLQYKDNHVLLSEEESYQLKDTFDSASNDIFQNEDLLSEEEVLRMGK